MASCSKKFWHDHRGNLKYRKPISIVDSARAHCKLSGNGCVQTLRNMVEFEQFEHKADVGIRGYGKNMEEAFENGARAMFSIMINLKKVEAKKQVEIKCEAANLEELFVEWLNVLLAEAGMESMVFSDFKIKEIKKTKSIYKLRGMAKGEELDPKKHEVKIEVKAATYGELKVLKEKDRCIAQTIVDV